MTADATLPADYPDLGRLLRDTRESAAMSREEAAERLKIRPSFVEALEKGDISRLPGEVYARGYFRAYAELLGYDSAALLGQIAAPPPKPQATRYLPPEKPAPNVGPAVAVAICLLALFGGWWMMSGRDDGETAPRVTALPASLDSLLDRGSPRLAEEIPVPCLAVSGEKATLLCTSGEWFVARRLNDGVPSLLALPARFPLWQSRPGQDMSAATESATDGADEIDVRPRYQPPIPRAMPAGKQEADSPKSAPENEQPLWLQKGRFQ